MPPRPLDGLRCWVVFAATALADEPRNEIPWRAGTARVKIAPERPVALLGYGDRTGPFESVIADIHAKALALEDASGHRGVIVTADLVGFQAVVVTDDVCRQIAARTGLERHQLLFNASHSHTGPLVSLNPHGQANSVAHPPLSESDQNQVGFFTTDVESIVLKTVCRLALQAGREWSDSTLSVKVEPDPGLLPNRAQVDKNVRIPLRDGVTLSAEVWRPIAAGRFPVLLQVSYYVTPPGIAETMAQRGYVCVLANSRGRGGSTGEWDPHVNEPQDVFDAQQWAGTQSWSDGRVGMFGQSYNAFTQIQAPAYFVSGWYDNLIHENFRNFRGFRESAGGAAARQQTRLRVGPGVHGANPLPLVEQGRWYDYWLKDLPTGIDQEAPLRIFVMGANRWRDEYEWPLGRTQFTKWYLHSDGHANTDAGDGRLKLALPPTEMPVDRYDYDPERPVFTLGGQVSTNPEVWGPQDRQSVAKREDVLVYQTEPLAADTEVTGPVELVLFAASSACDTDFAATLSVETPRPATTCDSGSRNCVYVLAADRDSIQVITTDLSAPDAHRSLVEARHPSRNCCC